MPTKPTPVLAHLSPSTAPVGQRAQTIRPANSGATPTSSALPTEWLYQASARVDTALCRHFSRVFTTRSEAQAAVHIRSALPGGGAVRIVGSELVMLDYRLLLILLYRATQISPAQQQWLANPPQTDLGERLRTQLNSPARTIVLPQLRLADLFKDLQYRSDGQGNYEALRQAFTRLAALTFAIVQPHTHREALAKLLSYEINDRQEITVALNPFLAQAITDVPAHGYTRISIHEMLTLGDVAMKLHGILSTLLRPGESNVYALDELVEYVYPPLPKHPYTRNTLRQFRWRLRQALQELQTLTRWQIDSQGAKAIRIARLTLAEKDVPVVSDKRHMADQSDNSDGA